jgi:Cytochrome P450
VLVSGEKQGVYTRDEVMSNAILLLVAGHETTLNLLCNGTLAFIQHPDQWQQLKQDPAGRAVHATEECLRYDAPVKSLRRTAVEDVELHGKRIRQNDRIRWFISAANRDPRVFPEPDQFNIARDPNPHVAFGSGIHHCLGAHPGPAGGARGLQGPGSAVQRALPGDRAPGVPSRQYFPLPGKPAGLLAFEEQLALIRRALKTRGYEMNQ